jgi:hypothetical protein
MRRPRILLTALTLILAGCGPASEAPDPPNAPVEAESRALFPLSMDPDEAVAVSRDFLARMRHWIAAPALHRVADIDAVWAISAGDAWQLDPCIPRLDDPTSVWVTRGTGDYLNLTDFAWSRSFGQFDQGFALACRGAAPSGTIVIDDTTGYILGIYPGDHDGLQPDASGAPATAGPE